MDELNKSVQELDAIGEYNGKINLDGGAEICCDKRKEKLLNSRDLCYYKGWELTPEPTGDKIKHSCGVENFKRLGGVDQYCPKCDINYKIEG